MPRLFETLRLLDERDHPGGAAWNMAMDEALLTHGAGVVLRFYRWEREAFSFGYFLPWQEALAAAEGRELVRRWTGGGMVSHGKDVTWSLIIPAGEPAGGLRPAESYAAIHGALAEALGHSGVAVCQVSPGQPAPAGGLCFIAPAPGDLLVNGQKIAGAGQRRCRHGLLHQGSICGVELSPDFPGLLATALSRNFRPYPAEARPVEAAQALVVSRYGHRSWTEKR